MKSKPKVSKKKVVKKKQNTEQKRKAIQKNADAKGDYLLSVYFNEQAIETSGNTSFDAFDKVVMPKGVMIKTKVIVTLLHADKKAEQVFVPIQVKRMFGSRISKEIWAKRVESKLK